MALLENPGERSQTRFYVHANKIRLHYLEFSGEGPPLILLPGITSPAMSWAFVGRALTPANQVYILDNRGRGLSDQTPGLKYTLDEYAADTVGFIRELKLKRPIIVGHSMGARIGVRLAAKYPDDVGRLVIIDPPVSGPGRRPYPPPLAPYLQGIKAASQGLPLPARPLWTPEQITVRAEWLPTCSLEAVEETYRLFGEEDIHADMPNIRSPALLVYAEQGDTVFQNDADEIVALIPDCRAVRVDGVGHMIPWDNLSKFLHAMQDFIAGG